MKEEIKRILGEFIARDLMKQPTRKFGSDEALISGGLIDSFSLVDLALFVENTWAVRIADTELNAAAFDTLDELSTLIEARKGQEA